MTARSAVQEFRKGHCICPGQDPKVEALLTLMAEGIDQPAASRMVFDDGHAVGAVFDDWPEPEIAQTRGWGREREAAIANRLVERVA